MNLALTTVTDAVVGGAADDTISGMLVGASGRQRSKVVIASQVVPVTILLLFSFLVMRTQLSLVVL